MLTPHRRIAFAIAIVTPLLIASAARAQTRSGWSIQWEDTFSGSAVDAARWEVLTRKDSYNNEKQYYTPNAVTVAGGTLNLTASNVPLAGKAYQSGLVRTWAEQTYGRWEIRASLPGTQGMWPAIWLLPRNVDWPGGGEIDMMENRGSAPNAVGSAYHFGPNADAHQFVAQDFGYTANGTPVSFQNSFHDYAVEWDASRIRYFVDGAPAYTIYRNAAPISASPMSLILNLAVGGDYGGDPNASTQFPGTLKIDSVRVYNRNAATANVANRSFETNPGDLLGEWAEYSNGNNVGIDETPANARTGSAALKLFGRFNGTNTSGAHQEIPTTPGSVVQFDAWSRNRPNDKLAGANEGRIKIEFIDANGKVIDAGKLVTVDVNSSTTYRQFALRRVAPAGAVFARAVIEMSQANNAGGAFNVDDVNLRSAAGAIAGDLDLDGTRAAADVDLVLHSLTADNSAFDFDANGVVNRADVTRLLSTAFGTVDGDANLDGRVNYADLQLFVAKNGTANVAGWATADFTGEGNVDAADRAFLQKNYGAGVPAGGSRLDTDFAYAYAQAAGVPEPVTLASLAGAALAAARRRSIARP